MIEYTIVTSLPRQLIICDGMRTHIQSKIKISVNEGMFTLNFDNMTNDYNYVVYELCHFVLLAFRIYCSFKTFTN